MPQGKSEPIYLHSRQVWISHPLSSYLKGTQPQAHQTPDHLGLLEL